MKKDLLLILAVCAAFVAACKPHIINPEEPDPKKDDTIHDTIHDTIREDTIVRVDTISIDTITYDTTINLNNDRVVCSYVEWYGNKLPDPSKVTNICYAFAELYVRDGVYQKFDLSGKNWNQFKRVIKLKEKNPNLKIQISFSHVCENDDNFQGGGFSMMAKSEEQMARFAHDCKEFCREWNLDGIDIDWELPGLSWSGHACDPAVDTENYTRLMKLLRDSLPFGEYLLTYAGYPKDMQQIEGGWRFINNIEVEPYVDWFNVMTYDMGHGKIPHNAMKCPDADWDIWNMYNQFNKKGYPMHKMVLGIAFYGRCNFDEKPECYDYNVIAGQIKNGVWTSKYHPLWNVPYVIDRSGNVLCSYDDERSIAYKANWANLHNLRGFMWWAQGGDDTKGTLTTACWNGLKTETQKWQYMIYHLSDSTQVQSKPIQIFD
ncbi:MAG: hypothetical protein KBS42_06050 [Bacteroidales bacterium]|nr:hypothetical protein [Candidatus Colicola coprequi]